MPLPAPRKARKSLTETSLAPDDEQRPSPEVCARLPVALHPNLRYTDLPPLFGAVPQRDPRGRLPGYSSQEAPTEQRTVLYCPFCGRGFIYLFFSVDTCYLHYSNRRKPGTGRERRGGVEEACARGAEAWVPSCAVLLLVSIPASAKWAGSATPLASPRDFLSHGRGSLRTCSVWENNP